MPIDFPNSPVVGDQHASGGTAWSWDGSVWNVVSSAAAVGPTGPTGSQGDIGPQGDVGPQGVVGDTGPQGVQGVQGVTGGIGSQGVQGVTGPTGQQGIQGIQGDQGIQGVQGDTGPQGVQGDTGLQGVIGDIGPQGDTGPTGSPGTFAVSEIEPISPVEGDIWFSSLEGKLLLYYDNFWIETIVGEIGPTGDTGATGLTGDTGPQGVTGAQGTDIHFIGSVAAVENLPPTGNSNNDAYIVDADGNLYVWDGSAWVDAGQIVGPQGDTGPQGAIGDTGPQGDQGLQGIQGIQGVQGDTGLTGDTGPQGATGDTGPQGLTGDTGLQGATGDTGPAGADGATGVDGASVRILASYTTSEYNLATLSNEAGTAYLVDGNLYFWNTVTEVYDDLGSLVGPQGETGATGGFNSTQTVSSLSSNYSIVLADAGVLYKSSAAVTVTVDDVLEVGQQVDFIQMSSQEADQITFIQGSGVTLSSRNGNLKTAGLYAGATIKCVALGVYVLIGDLAA